MKTIEEKNRMIAEFMGLELEKNDFVFMPLSNKLVFDNSDYPIWATKWGNVDCTDKDDAGYIIPTQYHTSWDWLMPVVNLCVIRCEYSNQRDRITFSLLSMNIEKMYNVVVQFIEWHNENK